MKITIKIWLIKGDTMAPICLNCMNNIYLTFEI